MMDEGLQRIAQSILIGMNSAATVERSERVLATCRNLDLISDWNECPQKVRDFARLCAAAAEVLPEGGSIETGVLRGGTSGILVLCDSRGSFHVSIDPYGLPSQSYANLLKEYGQWPVARLTMAHLGQLSADLNITHCHYYMAAADFIRANHLTHPGNFRIIHLDGDHSHIAVVEELVYFKSKLNSPALFILDDHDDHFPGVASGLRAAGADLIPVSHWMYDFPNYGQAGFSAWLFGGQAAG